MSIDKPSLLITEAEPDPYILSWLTHDTSLTAKLKKVSGEASLSLLSAKWSVPDWWDKMVLKIRDERVYRREILMSSASMPCWYARTLIPESCYHLDQVFFNRLKQESLNHLIFDEDKVQRTSLFHYFINEHCIETHWLPDHFLTDPTPLWLRFSEFNFMNKATFYLCEVLHAHHLRQLE